VKNALVLFLILISQNSLVAQSKIDSLLHKLETSKKDTARINILNAIGFQFQKDNIDSANHYYYKANKLAKEINNKLKESQTLKHIGYCKSLTGDYEGARLKYKQALKLIESKEPDRDILKLRAALYTNIGSSYTEQSNYKEALKYFFKALRINEPMKNEAGIANDYGNLGIVYIELSEFGKALDYLEKALKINKKLNLKNQIIVNLSNIANVHAWQQNHKLALEYYSEVIKLSDESGDKRTKAANLGNIGTVYQEQGNYDEALKYYFQAITIFEELGNNYGQAVFLGNNSIK
jgi:tetratricopeptide (TPR) repeat protein